jgi:hypothetical protein
VGQALSVEVDGAFCRTMCRMPSADQYWKENPQELAEYGTWAAGQVKSEFEHPDSHFGGRDMALTLPDHTNLGNISNREVDPNDVSNNTWQDQHKEDLVGKIDAKDEAGKLNLLNKMTQNVGGDDASDAMCGAETLLAAAVKGGGTDGIKAILASEMANAVAGKDEFAKKQIGSYQKALASGKLSVDDMHGIASELNYELRLKQVEQEQKYQKEHPEDTDFKPSTEGLSPETMQNFIKSSSTMSGYFKDGHMSIDSVDTKSADGASAANHYTLSMATADGASAVYDPFARKDGNQVIYNPLEVKNYHEHRGTDDGDRIDGKAFGGNPFSGMY